jgi:hypothetical protein
MIYRIELATEGQEHAGFEWFRTYKQAVARLRDIFNDPTDTTLVKKNAWWFVLANYVGSPYYSDHTEGLSSSKRESWKWLLSNKLIRFKTPKSKDDMLYILNRYGSHPDNG